MRIKREHKKSKIQRKNGIKALKDKCLIEKEPNYRPPPKSPYILDANGEVIGIIENMVPKTRPPLKLPRIHGNVDREGIKDLEKECLLDTVLNKRPPPKPPPKVYNRVKVSWTK